MDKIIIRYVKHENLNLVKWDTCIANSFNGIAYAFSWYLDIVSDNWDALVYGDYEAVMPLPIKRKIGFRYMPQPVFAQQLGVFSNIRCNQKLVEQFLKRIPVGYFAIQLNTYNYYPDLNYKIQKRQTYELDLIANYKKLRANYTTNTRRNLEKAYKNKIKILKGLAPNELIQFLRNHLPSEAAIREKHYNYVRMLASFSLRHRIGNIYGAYTRHNNLCAVAFFITSHNKSIMLLNASDKQGRADKAMFALIDNFIKNNAQKNLILDFEGSMIDGVARFYRGFGAVPVNYLSLRNNSIPRILQWINHKNKNQHNND